MCFVVVDGAASVAAVHAVVVAADAVVACVVFIVVAFVVVCVIVAVAVCCQITGNSNRPQSQERNSNKQ